MPTAAVRRAVRSAVRRACASAGAAAPRFSPAEVDAAWLLEADAPPGPEAHPVVDAAAAAGKETLERLCRAATAWLLGRGGEAPALFTDAERAELAEALAAVLAAGELAGRAAVRSREAGLPGGVSEGRLAEAGEPRGGEFQKGGGRVPGKGGSDAGDRGPGKGGEGPTHHGGRRLSAKGRKKAARNARRAAHRDARERLRSGREADRKGWQARRDARDARRERLADCADLPPGPETVTPEAAQGRLADMVARAKAAGLDTARLEASAAKAQGAVGKAAAKRDAAAEAHRAAQQALAAHEADEPPEPPDPGPKLVLADPNDFPRTPEGNQRWLADRQAARAEWGPKREAWEAANPKEAAAYEAAVEKWEPKYEKWDEKRDKLQDKADAAEGRLDELTDALGESWEKVEGVEEQLGEMAAEAESGLDAEDEEDAEPDEPDYPEEPEEPGKPVRESADAPERLQSTRYTCGPAALASALACHGVEMPEAELARLLGSDPREGTRPAALAALARRLGCPVEEAEGLDVQDLAHSTAQGVPVLCCVQMHGGGHWVVVTDADGEGADVGRGVRLVRFMDPVEGDGVLRAADWLRIWHDRDADGKEYVRYGLAVGPPAGPVREAVQPAEPLPPERALDYFLGLAPTLGVDPLRFGDDMRRRAFTLALATEEELLQKVQAAIADVLASGEAGHGADAVQAVLDAAGVFSPDGYADLVFRTNVKDSFDQGYQEELSAAQDTFPVWRMSNPDDSRSRKTHAERNGNYYPSSVPFTQVRGTDAADVINCRCVPIAVDKWSWQELQTQGARLADGY